MSRRLVSLILIPILLATQGMGSGHFHAGAEMAAPHDARLHCHVPCLFGHHHDDDEPCDDGLSDDDHDDDAVYWSGLPTLSCQRPPSRDSSNASWTMVCTLEAVADLQFVTGPPIPRNHSPPSRSGCQIYLQLRTLLI